MTQTSHTNEYQPKDGSVFAGVLYIMTHPGKWFVKKTHRHYKKKYRNRYKHAKKLFIFDLILLGIIAALAATALYFAFWYTPGIVNQINLEATVAPREVVSGEASTLVLRYENNSEEKLQNVRITLGYPNHFLLQETIPENYNHETNTLEVGSLDPGANGQLKIIGVMFGDVGGEQTFRSTMSFTYGENNTPAQKISYHTFSPARSTLELSLDVPERMVVGQQISGQIIYKNAGEIDFPQIAIQPEWPQGFTLTSSNIPLNGNIWILDSLNAGEEGLIEFDGTLGISTEQATFTFKPSFYFDDEQYHQESLTKTVELLAPLLEVVLNSQNNFLTPGVPQEIGVSFKNTGDFPLTNIELKLSSESPFINQALETDYTQTPQLELLNPGDTGTFSFSVTPRSNISQSETKIYSNLSALFQSQASYVIADEQEQQVTTSGDNLELPITTPFFLETFGRYYTAQGEQLGRGPLPPEVGSETKYWVFIRLGQTTNMINNLEITADLPSNVEFTGRSSVAIGESIYYNPATHSITWSLDELEPTFGPYGKIIGISFEVAITPSEDQLNQSPPLLSNIQATSSDSFTKATLYASGQNISTDIPTDTKAADKGVVEDY